MLDNFPVFFIIYNINFALKVCAICQIEILPNKIYNNLKREFLLRKGVGKMAMKQHQLPRDIRNEYVADALEKIKNIEDPKERQQAIEAHRKRIDTMRPYIGESNARRAEIMFLEGLEKMFKKMERDSKRKSGASRTKIPGKKPELERA